MTGSPSRPPPERPSSPTAAPPSDVRDQLAALRRRRVPVLAVAGIAVVVAVVLTLLGSKSYTSSCDVLVVTQRSDPVFGFSLDQSPDPERVLQSSVALLESADVRGEVAERVGSAPLVSATALPHSNVIRLTVTADEPGRAALLAGTYAQVFIDDRIRQASDTLRRAAGRFQPKIDELQSRIDAVAVEMDQLSPAQQAAGGSGLKARRDQLIAEQVEAKQRQTELEVASSIQDGGARTINPPRVPSSPEGPGMLLIVVMALGVGLIAGATVAMVLDHLDDSVQDVRALRSVAGGIPVLAEIPRVPEHRAQGSGSATEAYRHLRTSLQATIDGRDVRLLQVTSPSPGEGKTTTVANLAVSLTAVGLRVVMVCLDLRRPALHEAFGLSRDVGFTSAIHGQVSLSEALQKVPGNDRLSLLAAGPTPADPTAVLASTQTDRLLAMLAERHDLVLVDTPPLLPVADAAVLASRMHGVIVVASAGSTRRQELIDGLAILDQVHGATVGLVLNGTRARRDLEPAVSQPAGAPVRVPPAAGQGLGPATERVSGR